MGNEIPVREQRGNKLPQWKEVNTLSGFSRRRVRPCAGVPSWLVALGALGAVGVLASEWGGQVDSVIEGDTVVDTNVNLLHGGGVLHVSLQYSFDSIPGGDVKLVAVHSLHRGP